MILKYGSRTGADGEVAVVIGSDKIMSERGRIAGIRHTWTLTGFLTGSTQAAITTAIQQLERDYAKNGGDLRLYSSNGSTLSAHQLLSADCHGGTRIKSLRYPQGAGAEYSAGFGRTYEVVIEGDVLDSAENLFAWHQSFSFKGVAGAQKWLLVPTLNGIWDKQPVNETTPVRITQHGVAIGQFRHPVPPPPRWPADEHIDERQIDKKDPERVGSSLTNYEVTWTYSFEAMVPRQYSIIVP